jgi:hypothetical protein
MKLLFWSALIIGAIWLLMKKNLGGGNDLTAHFAEQQALKSIGDSATSANNIGQGNWPLSTIGQTPFAGISLNPFDASSIFQTPFDPIFNQSTPSFNGATGGNPANSANILG